MHMTENLEIHNETMELKSLTQANFTPMRNFHWHYEQTTQFLTIDFHNVIFTRNNNYSISIGFKGHIKDDNAGFYKSSYTDPDGNKRFFF